MKLKRYAELRVGREVLWRGTGYKQALSVRSNRRLLTHNGSKVAIAEVVTPLTRPLGFVGGQL